MTGIALAGAGKWGSNWLRTLAGMPEVSLRWCCDGYEPTLAKVREQYPAVPTTTQFADLLSDPQTQGIVLATSAPTHFAMAKDALEAGKHVMVEKPMTLTTADAVTLNAVATKAGRVLMVGHLMEYHPALPAIGGLIKSGEMGRVTRIESRRTNQGTLRSDENVWWSFAPHDVSMCVRLMGDWPTSVRAEGQCIVQPKIADVAGATLTFPGGRVARIDVSWHDPAKVREMKVYGTKKWAVLDDALPRDKQLMLHDRGFDASDGKIAMRQNGATAVLLDGTQPLVAEAAHFVECIRTGRRPISDGEAGAAVVSVLEHGQESMDTGREVAIERPRFG